MHICTIVPSYLPHFGGAEVGLHTMLSYLTKHSEHRFSVITATTDKALSEYEVLDGVHVYRYQRSKYWAKGYLPILNAFQAIPDLVKQLQPDLINITYLVPSGFAAWWIAKQLEIPVMTMVGGNDIYDPFNMPDSFLQFATGYCLKRFNAHIAWSTWSADRMSSHFGVERDQINVVPFGIDLDIFHNEIDGHSIRKRHNISDDTILLFALQRLELRKGVDILVRAIKHVVDTLPDSDFKLIIGGKGRDSEHIKQLIQDLQLEEYITLAGFIPEDEKSLYYAAADIFTFHSYHEGLGIVIIEAAACGLPTVTTRAGGTLDVVKEGETGLLSEPGDADAFAESIIKLLNNPNRLSEMGEQSANFAYSNFRLDVIAQKMLNIIN